MTDAARSGGIGHDVALRARAAWDAQDWARAAELYELPVARRPDDPLSYIWFFDCALAYKALRAWDKALDLGREAAARAPRSAAGAARRQVQCAR